VQDEVGEKWGKPQHFCGDDGNYLQYNGTYLGVSPKNKKKNPPKGKRERGKRFLLDWRKGEETVVGEGGYEKKPFTCKGGQVGITGRKLREGVGGAKCGKVSGHDHTTKEDRLFNKPSDRSDKKKNS